MPTHYKRVIKACARICVNYIMQIRHYAPNKRNAISIVIFGVTVYAQEKIFNKFYSVSIKWHRHYLMLEAWKLDIWHMTIKNIVSLVHNWPTSQIYSLYTKFDITHLLLALKKQMITCLKEKRTRFKISLKKCYKLWYFRIY